jgi:hypothetical protein
MMKKLIAICLLAFMLSGCSILENSLNKRVIQTLTALPSLTPYPTSTPYPTYTYYPTITRTPTLLPAAAFVKWNVDQVILAFKQAGLEVGPYRSMIKEDYAGAPVMSLQGICFYTSSNGEGCTARVLSFLDQTSLEKTRQFFIDNGYTWLFTNQNILVEMNPEVNESTARTYESIFNEMK